MALGAVIAISPSVGFAKENDKNNGNKGKNKQSCARAYGHLIAPGWIKMNGGVSADAADRCHIPKGIAKKLVNWHNDNDNNGNGNDDDDSDDTTAPIISSIETSTTRNSAVIRWETNEDTTTKVYVSTTSPVSKTATGTQVITRRGMTETHAVTVPNLSATTTYYVLIEAKDDNGNVSTSNQFSFVTKGSSTSTDIRAPFITNLFSTVASTSARIFWDTNESATTRVYYSTTSPVVTSSTSTAYVENTSLVTDHEIMVSGLSTSTRYYMVAESRDSSGNVRTSSQFRITTDLGL